MTKPSLSPAIHKTIRMLSQPPETAPSSGRSQLTPQDWIDAAAKMLVDNGIDAVRVDVLAKIMGVTRGSFYWHFKDREDLIQRLLMAWRAEATEQLIERFESRRTPPAKLVEELLNLPLRGRSAQQVASTELAIRAWARRDETARRVVDEVDAQRLSYMAQCFSSMGCSIAEARNKAFTLYAYQLSESLLYNQGNEAQKKDRLAFVQKVLLATESSRVSAPTEFPST